MGKKQYRNKIYAVKRKIEAKERRMVIENCTTFTEDEIAHYSKIFETIQTIKKLINAKVELNNELNKTFVLRFLKLKKLREQIQNIDNELKSLYKKLIHILVTRVMLRLGLKT